MADDHRPRKVGDVTIDPSITGRGWCDVCDEPTARRFDASGTGWRHGWCDRGLAPGRYLDVITGRSKGGATGARSRATRVSS